MDRGDDYDTHEENDDYNDDDDSPYDDELEGDKGDADDIADEMEAMESRRLQEEDNRRYDLYETMCDAAALRGEDVVEPIDPSIALKILEVSEQGKGKGICKASRKGRTATKGLRVSEPMHLKFDRWNRPLNKWRLKYGQQVGFCMRKLNICWNWKDVSEGKKKLMWEDTMNLFHIPDKEVLKKKFLSSVAKRFRDFKSKLVSGWIEKTRERSKFEDAKEPPEIWNHIREEDWKAFQKIQTSSEAKRKRAKAMESAKKNDHHHHLGQNSFNDARPTWIQDGFYPGSTFGSSSTGDAATSIVTLDVNRADDWFCSMHSKDKKSGKYIIKEPKTKEVAEKYVST